MVRIERYADKRDLDELALDLGNRLEELRHALAEDREPHFADSDITKVSVSQSRRAAWSK